MDLKVCRVCLINPGTILLYDRQNYIPYSEKIMKCVNIVICEGDGLPDAICEACVRELTIAYDFVCKCENSDNTLRSQENFIYHTQSVKIDIKEEMKLEENFLYDLKSDEDVLTENTGTSSIEQKQVKAYYPCDTCSSMFLHKESLKKHKNSQHSAYKKSRKRRLIRPIQCGVCGLVVETRSAMARHFRKHTNEKPFSCVLCNINFTTRNSLTSHVQVHQCGEKCICDICGSGFVSKNALIEHIKNHDIRCNTEKDNTQNTLYSCHLCTKTYRQFSSVLRHQLSHTGERRHACPVCHKLFYRKYDVQRHVKSMHSDRQYSCHLCNKVVKNENLLSRHLKNHNKYTQQSHTVHQD